MRRGAPHRGFTLVEVLVALAIVAIALAAGFRSVAAIVAANAASSIAMTIAAPRA